MSARWTTRLPDSRDNAKNYMWHRIETSRWTACGERLYDITTRTVRGRSLTRPPVGARVCPSCRNVGPDGWVGDQAYQIPKPIMDQCWPPKSVVIVFLEETPLVLSMIQDYVDEIMTKGRKTGIAFTDERPEPFLPFQVPTLDGLDPQIRDVIPDAGSVFRFGTYADETPADIFRNVHDA